MKDFVRVYGRIAGIAAGAAFVLSLLVGIASSNPFGVAFFRALVLALVFAAFGAGLRFVFVRYLSGLPASGSAPAGPASGRAVDITLPEEAPPVSVLGPEEPPDELPLEDAEAVPGAEAPAAGAPAALSGAAAPAGGGGPEPDTVLDDDLPPLTDAGAARAGPQPDHDDAGVERIEEAESVTEDVSEEPAARPGRPAADPATDPALDSLPDISSLGAPSARAAAGPGTRGVRRAPAPETPEDAMKGRLAGQDPASLARAIRTVLKREERG